MPRFYYVPRARRWCSAALHCVALLTILGEAAGAVPIVKPTVIKAHPHDPSAFTQGLLLHSGRFFESTGLHGRSSVREVTPATGAVLRRVELDQEFFGEGLALAGNRLIQLTWQNQVAVVYDLKTLKAVTKFDYEGEGWGLCFDGERLVMSDGSGSLFFRNPTSFDLMGDISVTLDGKATTRLNELECVGGLVYANVWRTSEILRIDPATGNVLTRIDATALVKQQVGADVLNGIAYDTSSGHFFLTGKLWSKVYETTFDFSRSNSAAQAPTPPHAGPRDAATGAAKEAATSTSPAAQSSTGGAACDCGVAGGPQQWHWWVPLVSFATFFLRRRT